MTHTLTGFPANPVATSTKTITLTPEPVQPTLPLLNVAPWRDLPADARLGGLADGFTQAFGPKSNPEYNEWMVMVNGSPITCGGIPPQDLRYVTDGKPHYSWIELVFGAHNTLDAAIREAVTISFLPKDAVYVGPVTGANSYFAGTRTQAFSYTSASLAAALAPHPDRVFINGQNQGVTAGTLIWSCTDGGLYGRLDRCIVAAGTLS